MPNGKLGEQLKVEPKEELKAGKLEQQLGVKPTVAYEKQKREYEQRRARLIAKQRAEQEKLRKEVETFKQKDLTYENYEKEYQKLSSEAKKFFTSPTELKQTQEFQEYQQYKQELAEYEKQKRDYEIARKFYIEGITPFALTEAQKKIYYEMQSERELYEEKLQAPEKFTTPLPIYQKDPELYSGVVSGDIEIKQEDGKFVFEGRELTPTEQEKIAAWSEKYQMTPSLETIKEIIKAPKETTAFTTSPFGYKYVDLTKPGGFEAYLKTYGRETKEFKPVSEVQPYQPEGLEKAESWLYRFGDVGTPESETFPSWKKGVAFAGLSLAGTARFGQSLYKDITGTGKGIGTFPNIPLVPEKTAFGIGKGIFKIGTGQARFPEVGRALYFEPSGAIGYVATEYATGIGTIKGARFAGLAATRISPYFRKFEKLEDLYISKGLTKIEGTWKSTKQLGITFPEQVSLAGKKVTAVSGATDFFKPFKPSVTIDKPLPTPTSPALERSFFADPLGRLRAKRLGLKEEKATWIDVVADDVSFKRTRPEAILVPEAKVAEFPKGFGGIVEKIKRGEQLTPTEARKFEEFQLTPTGEFKPVGFFTTEAEITLAPGEALIKKGTAGVTIIKGRRVPIIEAEIGQPSKATKELLESYQKGELGEFDIKELQKGLRKETGISYDLQPKKYFDIKGKIVPFLGAPRETTRIRTPTRRTGRRTTFKLPTYSPPVSYPTRGRIVRTPTPSKRFERTEPIFPRRTFQPSKIKVPGYKPPTGRRPPIVPPGRRPPIVPPKPPTRKPPFPTETTPFRETGIKTPRLRTPISIGRKPSLVALGEIIKAPRVARGEATGFVIRPIIPKKKKKRRFFI